MGTASVRHSPTVASPAAGSAGAGSAYRKGGFPRNESAASGGATVDAAHSPEGVGLARRLSGSHTRTTGSAEEGKRRGSVEGALPTRKRGGGGEANVAAALRSKRRGQILAESMPVDLRIHKPLFDKPPEVRSAIASALKENVLTSSLGPDVIRDLVNATQPRDVEAGAVIITQGDVGDNFYVIENGCYDILVNGNKVATFGDGTTNMSFGELALLFNSPRAATVVSSTPGRLWWLGRLTFRSLVATSSHEEHGRIKAALSRGLLAGLDVEQTERVADAATRVRFNDGDQIIRRGTEGSVFYVILEGEVLCTNIGGGQSDNVLSAGDYFGERALLKKEPRAADVFARGPTDLVALEREDFESLLGGLRSVLEHNLGLRLLLCVPFLGALPEEARTRLFGELRLVQYRAGKHIVREGRELKRFRIIKEGTARVEPAGDDGGDAAAADERTLLPGQWFGEAELLGGAAADASVVAVSPVQCFELGADAFRELLGGVEALVSGQETVAAKHKLTAEEARKARRSMVGHLPASAGGAAASGAGGGAHQASASSAATSAAAAAAAGAADPDAQRPRRRARRTRRAMLELSFSDLDQKATLGTGSFGRVKLVLHRPTGDVFALKALQKSMIVAMRQQKNVIREKEILAVVDHPFVIRLYQTFKDAHRLYMLLELVQGGELFSRLQASTHAGQQGTLPPRDTVFYAACVADALAHLHERNIAYRDLKPENLLIDSAGYIKVVDFGFAKVVRDRTYTTCGTPEYLAPELISGRGHNKGVDWWALGILVFEMAAGYSPFMDESDDQLRIARNIIRGDLVFPPFVSSRRMQSLVRALLHRDVSKRLGMLRGGPPEVKKHPFFGDIDWEELLAKKTKAPWRPAIRNKTDTDNFDPYDEDEALEPYTPDPASRDWDKDF